jgi:hypothetical protein
MLRKVENATYIVNNSMAAHIEGPWIPVREGGVLEMEIAWANTGAPVGTLTLEHKAQDGNAKTIPGAAAEFTTHPNSNTGDLTCCWREMKGYTLVRLKYTRGSGGTANTSFNAKTRTV